MLFILELELYETPFCEFPVIVCKYHKDILPRIYLVTYVTAQIFN